MANDKLMTEPAGWNARASQWSSGVMMILAALIMAVLLVACGDPAPQEGDPEPQDPQQTDEQDDPEAEEDPRLSDEQFDALSRGQDLTADRPRESVVVSGTPVPQSVAPPPPPRPSDREQYEEVDPNPVKVVAEDPVSTFSIDVDTASYAVMRRYLNDGTLPPSDAVRVEEMINYFSYDYPVPSAADEPFEPALAVMPSPWNASTQLLRIGIKGYALDQEETPPVNLVLLLDVSGSMNDEDKLPLLKKGMRLLVDSLDADDRVSIVVYAGASGVILEPTPGNNKTAIMGALDRLSAGGSTAGGEGIRLAYALAEQNFDEDAINRVILATDGDFNVGITDPQKLEDFIVRKRETGVYLTVLGFGRGNYNDALMQRLAQSGNGQAAYIDTLREAQKVLVDDLRATLFPIAKDVKIQVEFNPATVAEYRLIGYETRLLDRADFSNDAVDAGEIGSGHTVTALYEIARVGSDGRLTDPLRYQQEDDPEETGSQDLDAELAFVRIRYKLPDEDESRLIERPVETAIAVNQFEDAPDDARFAAAVAAFGQYLQDAPYLKELTLPEILDIAQNAKGADPYGYRAEFTQLVRLAQSAQAMEPLAAPPQP